MRFANIPPPMSLQEARVSNNIIDACFWESSAVSTQAAILDSKGISMFKWNMKRKSEDYLALTKYLELPPVERLATGGTVRTHYQQIVFRDTDHLLVLGSIGLDSRIYTLQLNPATVTVIAIMKSPLVHELILHPSHSPSPVCMWIKGGYVVESRLDDYECDGSKLSIETKLASLPRRLDKATLSRLDHLRENSTVNRLNDANVVFGLTWKGSLYADNRCLAKDCTSFIATSAHLIFTTSQHLLKFVHLTTVEGKVLISDQRSSAEQT